MMPKDAVDVVFESKRGLLGACSAGQLPRGITQAYNIKRREVQKEMMSGMCWCERFSG